MNFRGMFDNFRMRESKSSCSMNKQSNVGFKENYIAFHLMTNKRQSAFI